MKPSVWFNVLVCVILTWSDVAFSLSAVINGKTTQKPPVFKGKRLSPQDLSPVLVHGEIHKQARTRHVRPSFTMMAGSAPIDGRVPSENPNSDERNEFVDLSRNKVDQDSPHIVGLAQKNPLEKDLIHERTEATENPQRGSHGNNLIPKQAEAGEGPQLLPKDKKPLSLQNDDRQSLKLNDCEGNSHNCSVCQCCMTSPVVLTAFCDHRNLFEVPLNLPKNVNQLLLNNNALKVLNLTKISNAYPSLKYLQARNNLLQFINQACTHQIPLRIRSLHLDNNLLVSFEKSCSFYNLPDLKQLTLSSNKINVLTNKTFQYLSNLEHLDLSKNNIQVLTGGVFQNLNRLKNLSLANNVRLTYSTRRLQPAAFRNLISLRSLNLASCSGGSILYPDQALSQLINLEDLAIDGIHTLKGPNLSSLTSLSNVTFGFDNGRIRGSICNIKNLTVEFVANMPYLKTLRMFGCKIIGIDKDTFPSMSMLQTLELQFFTSLGPDKIFEALAGMSPNCSLRTLSLRHMTAHNGLPCRYLGETAARYVQYIPLTSLDLSHNLFALISEQFLGSLPKTLTDLNLAWNKLDINTFRVKNLLPLDSLKSLDISYQNNIVMRSKDLAEEDHATMNFRHMDNTGGSKLMKAATKSCENSMPVVQPSMCIDVDDNDDEDVFEDSQSPTHIKKSPIPGSLHEIKASGFSSYGDAFLLRKNRPSQLRKLDFSHGFNDKWGLGRLPKEIQELSVQNNYCKRIHRSFFDANNLLRKLRAHNNFLGEQFASDTEGDIFRHLNHVVSVDLSTNIIYKLPPAFFKGLKNIEHLVISNNRLQEVELKLAHMKSLKLLDLSRNSISWLSSTTREDLDVLAMNHKVALNLTFNPISCGCSSIPLLGWIANTRVELVDRKSLYCASSKGTVENLGDASLRLKTLQGQCYKEERILMIVIVSSAMALFLCVVLGGLMYRVRWRLIYLKNVTLARWFGFQPSSGDRVGRKFDAFLVYGDEDRDFVLKECIPELEGKRGHALCVADRDFLPGSFITTNITCGVQSSTYTVPVLTRHFLQDSYCEYAVQMATHEAIFEHRPTLFVMLDQSVTVESICFDLLKVIREDQYVEIPPSDQSSQTIRDHLWEQISQAIGRVERTDSCRPRLNLNESISSNNGVASSISSINDR